MMTGLESYTGTPSLDDSEELNLLEKEMPAAHEQIRKLAEVDLPNLNKLMNAAGIPYIILTGPQR